MRSEGSRLVPCSLRLIGRGSQLRPDGTMTSCEATCMGAGRHPLVGRSTPSSVDATQSASCHSPRRFAGDRGRSGRPRCHCDLDYPPISGHDPACRVRRRVASGAAAVAFGDTGQRICRATVASRCPPGHGVPGPVPRARPAATLRTSRKRMARIEAHDRPDQARDRRVWCTSVARQARPATAGPRNQLPAHVVIGAIIVKAHPLSYEPSTRSYSTTSLLAAGIQSGACIGRCPRASRTSPPR